MEFTGTIINWYHLNKRDLPWRKTRDPYKIWLSEVILQQTRVAQGLSYYEHFTSRYPSIADLAEATEQEVLRSWQGLGYYSRARNLHSAAKTIHHDLKGKFPGDWRELIRIKGIGEYTAAAIASFSFKQSVPVVDGNVYRVLSRFFGISTPIDSTQGKKEIRALAEELIDPNQPDTFNQAIMEFGALQCVPRKPDCASCPLANSCYAFAKGQVETLPVKDKKTKVKDVFFHYLVLEEKGHYFMKKRSSKGIWQNLFDFPGLETEKELSQKEIISHFKTEFTIDLKKTTVEISDEIIHLLSHRKIRAKFYRINSGDKIQKTKEWVKVKRGDDQFPSPVLITDYLKKLYS